MGFQRPEAGFRFNFQGMKTNTAADEMPPTKYPFASNVRYVKSLQTRPGYSVLFATELDITSSCPLPDGEVGLAYTDTLTAVGGVLPYVWSLLVGTLPNGLSLSAGGVITGTPTTAQTKVFTLKITDGIGTITTKSCSMTIEPAVSISTTCPLPDGTEGVAYDQTMVAIDGTAPYTWSISAGALPSGLSMDSTGHITGTPTTVESQNFTLRVVDSLGGVATKSCSLSIVTPFTANVYTNTFSEPATAHGSQDLGTMVGVINEPPFFANQTGVNITHDSDGNCLHFDYMTGNGQCNGGVADMTFAVPSNHALLGDSDQLSESVCVQDNSIAGSLTRSGPMCFCTGSWNGSTVTAYYISFQPETNQSVLTRMNTTFDTVIGTLKTAHIGDTQTITVKDTGTSTRVRLYVNGVLVDEVFDSSASRITAGSPGWMGRFCSAPRFSKWTPLVCAEPI